jgi:dTDP-4-amino-4,6-dideoxygalactose transaminase
MSSPSSVIRAPWPVYDEEQVQAAADVLRSGKVNYLAHKVQGQAFEKEFSDWCGAKRSLAVANGTVSIELILRALRLKPGDEVITTPRTFIASSSALVINGLVPVMADVDPDSGCITPETVEPHINERTRAILPVHLGGWPCDMEGFVSLAEEKRLHIIEDCAQSHGAKIKGRHAGTFGIANSWSFCQDKIMTTGGEGGMITTNDEDLWKRMWSLKDHGKDWDAVHVRQHPPGFRWLHENWGTNWRMTEFQSAVGRVQLSRMPHWHEERTKNASRLVEILADVPTLRTPVPSEGLTHAWYRVYTYVRPEALKDGWTRERIIEACAEKGLPLQVGSCSEIYLEKCFSKCHLGPKERLPVAKELGETSLALLVHPGLTLQDIDDAGQILAEVGREAAR